MIHNWNATSLAAGGTTNNLLSGKNAEVITRPTAMRLGAVSSAAGLLITILNGSQQVCVSEPLPIPAAAGRVTDPDDFHFEWIALGRQQIIITNPTGGALSYTAILKFQPV
jgi:hypothetical protein